MVVALKTPPKNGLFFDCFRGGWKQSGNSHDRNSEKQLKNNPETARNSHRNSHRNSRNSPLRGAKLFRPLARIPSHPAKHPHAFGFGFGFGRSGLITARSAPLAGALALRLRLAKAALAAPNRGTPP